MRTTAAPLMERLADIGGQLQKMRWEALDTGMTDLARDISHAIEAVAWAAGIYSSGANIIDRPGDVVHKQPVSDQAALTYPDRTANAA